MYNKILITGGCGFIGSCLIRSLAKNHNIEILNIDNLTYAANINATQVTEIVSRDQFKVNTSVSQTITSGSVAVLQIFKNSFDIISLILVCII